MSTYIDPRTFFATLLEDFEEDDRKNSSSSSEDDDDDEEFTSSRLLASSSASKKNDLASRWYQLAEESDNEDVVTYFDRLGQATRRETTEEEQEELKKDIKDQERRMRQRSLIFESDEEEDSRFVVSHKKRRIDELNAVIDRVEFLKGDKNWVQITEEIKELETKVIKKMLKMNFDFKAPPKKYIKFMVDLRNEISELAKNKAYINELPKQQKKALPKLIPILRNSEYLKQFNNMVEEYLNDKDNYDITENFGLEEEEEALRKAKEKLNQEEGRGARADSGPSKWLLSDASSTDEESDEDDNKANKYMDSDEEASSSEEEDGSRKEVGRRQGYKRRRRVENEEEEDDDFLLSDGQMEEKVAEFRSTRGKRLLTNQEIIEQLTTYYKHAKSEELIIQILTELIVTVFDKYSSSDLVIPLEEWSQLCEYYSNALEIIESNTNLKFVENKGEKEEKKKGVVIISGNPCNLVEQLETQYYKGLKYSDAYTVEYLHRLQRQANLLNVLVRTLLYYQSLDAYEQTGRIAFKILSQIYFRKVQDHKKLVEVHRARIPSDLAPATETILPDLTKTIENLSKIIFHTMTEDVVHKTVLMNVYHIALLGNYPQARDMLLMSGIPDTIAYSRDGDRSLVLDGDLQVLFNRVIAQLGLCAFRSGLVKEAFQTLKELFAYHIQQLKGFLGQSQRFLKDNQKQDMDKRGREELEKREKERFIPHNMHINTETIEVAFFISSMLAETAQAKQQILEVNKKRIQFLTSRKFFKKIEERNYNSPAEDTKDKLYAATLALADGNWEQVQESLASLDTWKFFDNKDEILKMLEAHVKVESMRAYIFTNMKYYYSISIERLADMFKLDEKTVRATLFRMISQDKLYAYIDEVSKTLKATKEEPNELQKLALYVLDGFHSQSDRQNK